MNYQPDDVDGGQSPIAINANSSANAGNNDRDENGLHTGTSAFQTPEEFNADKNKEHPENNDQITASGVDDLESNSDGVTGTDRAGTAGRKAFGDTELNKGLESQAKDGESV